MYRFEEDKYYRTSDPELLVIATPGTMAKWEVHGCRPSIHKIRQPRPLLGQGSERMARP